MPSAVVVAEGIEPEGRPVHPNAASVIEALRLPGPEGYAPPSICVCCEFTEHDLDKTGKHWLVFDIDRVEKCRRCGGDCCNRRCDELPANPDGRGYGNIKKFGR